MELAIPDARSLKDKRRVIKGIKQQLRNVFNVSVAEVAYNDSPKRCRLAVAMVSAESRPTHSQLDKLVDMVRHCSGLTLIDYQRELL